MKFGWLFDDWEDQYLVECLDCGNEENVSEYLNIDLKKVLKNLSCSLCKSKHFNTSSSEFNSISACDITFKDGLITSISYPILGTYGGFVGAEVVAYERIDFGNSIKRFIDSALIGECLIYEEFDLNGKLINANPHSLLKNFYTNKQLSPLKKSVNNKTVFKPIEIDYDSEHLTSEERDKRYIIDRTSEWILEIPFNDLEEVDGKFVTKKDLYEWGNQSNYFSGFANKTINSKNEFQRIYIFQGSMMDEHPVWRFNQQRLFWIFKKNRSLLSLQCALFDDEFNLF